MVNKSGSIGLSLEGTCIILSFSHLILTLKSTHLILSWSVQGEMHHPCWNGPTFQAQGAWTTIATELLLTEEFEQMGVTMETLQHVFPLHQVHPLPTAPAPMQGPPSPPTPGTPLMPDSLGEAHVVIDLPDTPEIVLVSSEDEGHQEEEDDPEEDQDIDEVGVEQQ